jgi:hypothetical protein
MDANHVPACVKIEQYCCGIAAAGFLWPLYTVLHGVQELFAALNSRSGLCPHQHHPFPEVSRPGHACRKGRRRGV